jgi:hypothetical protein
MPVGEMCSRMSAHELAVAWPAFFQIMDERRRSEEREAEFKSRRTF